ncbi:hypothetical protein [Enterobacter asburiae]|uniref:hypothetical protein n=1 Tax=Enterobacter asburiae TaxID=61645 RepID=UPI0032B3EADC
MSKVNVKPVLLNGEQIQALKTIQERERQKLGMGIAPSIHAVARKVFDAGLPVHDPAITLIEGAFEATMTLRADYI